MAPRSVPAEAVSVDGDDDLLSVREAAGILHIAEATLRKWQQRNEVRFYRMGRKILFRRGDLRDMLAAAEQPVVSR